MPEPETLTALLLAWGQGDQLALERLVPLVDRDLRQLSRRHMRREPAGHTLQTTALINEVFLRLVEGRRVRLLDRAHFFALATTLMRRILVDHARARRNLKRGGGLRRVSLSDTFVSSPQRGSDLIALDDALAALAALDPRRGRVVELRVFGGLSVEETAQVVGVSAQTVMRDWKLARVWLRRELQRTERHAS
jgi:RNA polymerase sigma-70 factor (ECF subfamily)